ncbi:MAG: dependent protein [Acidimicrobiaceae bacterium]|jgi:pyridoxal phosphate enzyme (YggS family)
MSGASSSGVLANLERVRDRIASAGGDPDLVRILAVTKGHGIEAVRAARVAGLDDIGENYAQELSAKADELDDPAARWHFIGQLQRNKVRQIAHLVHLWQSVDRLRLGEEISKRSPGAAVLVEVNLTDDPARGGAHPGLVPGLVDGLRDLGLQVGGLMAVGSTGAEHDVRGGFRAVRALADDLDLPERSMGMSGDLELAVREGSTMIRIGSALFGPRLPR